MKEINLRHSKVLRQNTYITEYLNVQPPAWAFAGLIVTLLFFGLMFIMVVL